MSANFPRIDAMVSIGSPRGDVRIPVRFGSSQGARTMVYASRAVPGWFSDGQVVAVCGPQGWRSRLPWDLHVTAVVDEDSGRWRQVRDGRVGV